MIAVVDAQFCDMDAMMSPKKRTARDDSSELPSRKPRMQALTLDQIKRQVETIKNSIAEILLTMSTAKKDRIETLDVDGANKMERASALLLEYSDKLADAHRKARRERILGRDSSSEID